MWFTDRDLDAFDLKSIGRETNDEDNKSREFVVTTLINIEKSELKLLRERIRNKVLFDDIFESLENALHQISEVSSNKSEEIRFKAVLKAGRTNNYDFDLTISNPLSKTTLAVELKKGKSIYDQPQFLQLYVNSPDVINDRMSTYAEFFYDAYFERIQEYTGCRPIEKNRYLKEVFGTKYDTYPFSELYKLVKESNNHRDWFKSLQYASIDEYIKTIIENPRLNINWGSLQVRLDQQLTKHFLSWDPVQRRFVWEKFDKISVTLSGDVDTKSKKNGLLTTLVLPTKSGQRIELLLRWKNNPCIKGPAWQIKLTE